MLSKLKRWLEFRKIRRRMIRDFYKEHSEYLPKYDTETGMRIYWNVDVVYEGEYDAFTGEPKDGEYKIIVTRAYGGVKASPRIYAYDVETKQVIRIRRGG